MSDLLKLKTVELRPDRKLIDSNFDSYKLSLATLPSYKAPVVDGVFQVGASDADLGFEKIRCLTLHNHLTLDPWNKEDVYYIDTNGCLRRYHIALETHIEPPKAVFSLGSEVASREKKLPPSLFFPSATLCVICDGFGGTFLLGTGLRSDAGSGAWKILHYDEDRRCPSLLLHAVRRSIDGDDCAECVDYLCVKFQDGVAAADRGEATTKIVIEWSSIDKANGTDDFQIGEVRLFYGKSVPMYAALSPDCSELHVASSTQFQFRSTWDTEIDGELQDLPEPVEEAAVKAPYKWKQNDESVFIYADLPADFTSSSIVYSLSSKHINVAFRESKDSDPQVLLSGDLYLDADPEGSTWIVEDNQLEVTLLKRVEGRKWVTVVEGDDRGEYVVDAEEAAAIHRQLSHLTSETLNAETVDEALFNSEQLEDCDAHFDSGATLARFDAASGKFTHAADISNFKWLFNYSMSAGDFPACVLRHDVDAVAWQPTPTTTSKSDARRMYKHVATFNALGYVHASKTNLKFCASPPDDSYAAFCECQRRVYVYRQPTPLATSLRNRTSGAIVGKVAIQQVTTIDGNDDILGFVATNERIYLLTEKQLIVFKVMVDIGA